MQFTPHSLRIKFFVLESEDSATRHDAQPGQLRKPIDNALGYAVRQIFHLRVGALIDKGEDGENCRGAVWSCVCWINLPLRLRFGCGRGNRSHRRHKTVASPWNGFDVLRLRSAFTKDPAQREDILRKIGLLNKRVRPNLFHQIILLHNVSAVSHQNEERLECLRRERDCTAVACEQTFTHVKIVLTKSVEEMLALSHGSSKKFLRVF